MAKKKKKSQELELDQTALDRARDILANEKELTAAEIDEAYRNVQQVLNRAGQMLRDEKRARHWLLTSGTDGEIAECDEAIRALDRAVDRATALRGRLLELRRVKQREEEIATLPDVMKELVQAAEAARDAEAKHDAARVQLHTLAGRYSVLYHQAVRAGVEPARLAPEDRTFVEGVWGRELDVPQVPRDPNAPHIVVDSKGGIEFRGEWTDAEKKRATTRAGITTNHTPRQKGLLERLDAAVERTI